MMDTQQLIHRFQLLNSKALQIVNQKELEQYESKSFEAVTELFPFSPKSELEKEVQSSLSDESITSEYEPDVHLSEQYKTQTGSLQKELLAINNEASEIEVNKSFSNSSQENTQDIQEICVNHAEPLLEEATDYSSSKQSVSIGLEIDQSSEDEVIELSQQEEQKSSFSMSFSFSDSANKQSVNKESVSRELASSEDVIQHAIMNDAHSDEQRVKLLKKPTKRAADNEGRPSVRSESLMGLVPNEVNILNNLSDIKELIVQNVSNNSIASQQTEEGEYESLIKSSTLIQPINQRSEERILENPVQARDNIQTASHQQLEKVTFDDEFGDLGEVEK